MKRILATLLLMVCVQRCWAQMTIDYTYDKQHRLTEVSYSASEKVFYSYDAANNLDLEVAVDNPGHLKSFMLWLSQRTQAVGGWFCEAGGAIRELIGNLVFWKSDSPGPRPT